jgi:hypothetical protein
MFVSHVYQVVIVSYFSLIFDFRMKMPRNKSGTFYSIGFIQISRNA